MIIRFRHWVRLAILLAFCLCVFLKLNGSSIGLWTDILNEPGKPRGLLFSTPKGVRADEWFGWTPAALSQSRQTPPFPIENLSLGGGRAPLIMSVPVKYYTMLFRPQYWGFFVFDFERAFSFYWCCKIFSLLLVSVWFFRQLGIRRKSIIVFGTLWIFFSDFVQWWFSSPAMLPEMLATWMLCTGCAIRFFKETNPWRSAATVAVFVYSGLNFVLCLYPPFQIPLVLVMIALVVGSCFEARVADEPCWTARGISLAVLGLALIALLLILFWIDVRPTLDLVAHTDYPGSRRSSGGDLSLFRFFSGLTGFFQTDKIFPHAFPNICEASNFYPLWPAVLLAVVVARWRQISAIPPLIFALGIVVVFLSIYCLVPLPAWLLRGTFLNFATERRTLLALGVANIFLSCLFLDRYREQIFQRWLALTLGLTFWFAVGLLFWTARLNKPGFFPDHRQIITALVANGVIIFFFWETKRRLFAGILATLVVLSNFGTNPVMRGLAPLLESGGFREVDKIRATDPKAKWLVYHDFVLANLVIATGAPIYNGNKVVPDFNFLHKLDPDGGGNPIYNRYAYVNCEIPDETHGAGVHFVQYDCYTIYLPPESPLLADLGCRFFLFPEIWPQAEAHGFSLVKEIQPAHIWVYQSQLAAGF